MDAKGDTFCLEGLCTPSLLLKELWLCISFFLTLGYLRKD